ncbi:TonB-dependent receptor domain-containing protein [Spirosoma oryzicola]|uniref:TonB-dependent receptor domain-containing protein n=1 Tax=Spirosoma oryzicola TaxID=2898794 RepID=UPI001E316DD7|nr:TonB-dependent receptor [Spirosoma oryzicola]UHG89549.1 TonB-dependent receptor [Spirosoma oryzicola]
MKRQPLLFCQLTYCVLLMLGGSLMSSLSLAQSSVRTAVMGKVHDPAGKPLEFATLMLVKASDSTLVKGTIGDAEGGYTFDNVKPGTYQVTAQVVGFQKTLSRPFTVAADQPQTDVPALVLNNATKTLGEVTVTGQKPFIEQLPDKTVVNVENSIVSAGGTALEVLEKAPGVVVDNQNDRISFKGREGVLVMIDGKPTYLSAQEVVNLLRNTPSNSVQTIELITNPSSKYDAAGNAGIINIRLKRGSRAVGGGTAGSATFGAGYGRYPKASAGATLNHKAGNWNLFGNYNYDYRQRYSSVDALRRFGAGDSLTTVNNLGTQISTERVHTFKAGADYALSRNTTVGVMINGLLTDRASGIDNTNLIYNAQHKLQQTVTMTNTSTRPMQRLSANANLKHTFDTLGRELTIDLDYGQVHVNGQDNMRTRYVNAQNEEIRPPLLQLNQTPSAILIQAVKADYVHPMRGGLKLETGGKISYVTSDNDVRFGTVTESGYVPDPQRTNHFLYKETIGAGYLSGSQSWAKWSVQAGVRLEYTRSVGNSVTLQKVVDRSYLNAFPSAFLTYKASPDHQWTSSYSRRIDRPSYQDLNPFIYVMDPYTFAQGNPFLRPQYTNAFQVGYTYKNETNVSLGYNHTTDVITGVNEQQGQVLKSTTVNLAVLNNIVLSLSTPLKLTAWWTVRQTADIFLNAYDAEYLGERLDYRRVSANFTMNHRFTLAKGFTAELSGWYNTASIYGQGRFGGMGQVNVGLQKTMLAKAATLRLNVSDILDITRNRGTIQYAGTNLTFTNRWETRVARLTFTYNFGNRNLKVARQRQSSVEDEQSRVR